MFATGTTWVVAVVLLGTGRPPDPQALADRIDRRLAASWNGTVTPAPAASDAEFLRRAYLDLTGRIPTPRDVYDFQADPDPDKRGRLVDDLLETPRHAAHFAAVWRAALIPEAAADPTFRVFQPGFEAWLRQQFRHNAPYDQLVRDLLAVPVSADPAAPDPVLRDPAAANPLAFVAVKEAKPENLAAATARVFLGIQIECAQCHDHPFARWERDRFWGLAAFFTGVERQGDGAFAPVADRRRRAAAIPDTTRTVPASYLDGAEPVWAADANPRAVLAAWVTARDNPYFARAAANRVWGHLFGVGLVDPVDDVRDDNPPSHPELLDDLAGGFAESGFDLRFLLRAVCRTAAYRRSSARTDPSQDPPTAFARMAVKALTGEQFFDSVALATGFREEPSRGRASARDRFVSQFAPGGKPTEPDTSVTQALTLMNGGLVARVTAVETSPTLRAVCETPGMDTPARVDALYLAALGRQPTAKEAARATTFVDEAGTGRRAERLGDLFWALLNSAEFRLNH